MYSALFMSSIGPDTKPSWSDEAMSLGGLRKTEPAPFVVLPGARSERPNAPFVAMPGDPFVALGVDQIVALSPFTGRRTG